MDPIEKQERKREAWRRLNEQRQRVGMLRGRVVAISLIAFVLLWGVVFTQMATGNDPVLGDSSKTVSRTRSEPAKGVAATVETTDPAEIESQRIGAEPAEPEVEESDVEAAEVEAAEIEEGEAEFAESESEFVEPEPEFVEAEPEFVEPEPEPLTTSQS